MRIQSEFTQWRKQIEVRHRIEIQMHFREFVAVWRNESHRILNWIYIGFGDVLFSIENYKRDNNFCIECYQRCPSALNTDSIPSILLFGEHSIFLFFAM